MKFFAGSAGRNKENEKLAMQKKKKLYENRPKSEMAANLIPPPIISLTRKRLVETNDSSCSYFWKWMTVKRIFLLFDTSWLD